MTVPVYSNDNVLIEAIKQKDRQAFNYLYKEYTGVIKNFVKTNSGQEADAEEIEQNVIIHLYEKIVSGDFTLNENTRLSTYMFAVGKNMWFKKLRRGSNELPGDQMVLQMEDLDFYDDMEDDTLESEVVIALQNSDDDCKTILQMYYYDKKSMREIAAYLGTISEENLRKRKYKCIQKLKKVVLGKIQGNG